MTSTMRPVGPPEPFPHSVPGAFPPPPRPDRVDISQRRNTISVPMSPPGPLPYHNEIKEFSERLKRLGIDEPQNTTPKKGSATKDRARDKSPQAKSEEPPRLYQGWSLFRGETPSQGRNWDTTTRSKMPLSQKELIAFVKKKRTKKSVPEEYRGLSALKQQHVDNFIRELKGDEDEDESRFKWTCIYLHPVLSEVREKHKTKLVISSIDIVMLKELKSNSPSDDTGAEAAPPEETAQVLAEEPEPIVQPMEEQQSAQNPFIRVPIHPEFPHGGPQQVGHQFVPGIVNQPGNQREEPLSTPRNPPGEVPHKDFLFDMPPYLFSPVKVHFQEPPNPTANVVPEMLEQNSHRPFVMPHQPQAPEPVETAQVHTTPSKQYLFDTRYHSHSGPPPLQQQPPQERPKRNQPFTQPPSQPRQRPQVRIHQKPGQTRVVQRQQPQEQRSQPPPPPKQHYPAPQVVYPEPTASKRMSGNFNEELDGYLEEVSSNEGSCSPFDTPEDSSYITDDSLSSDDFDDNASELSNVRCHQRRATRHLQLQLQKHQVGYRTHGRPGPKYYSSGSSGNSGTQYSLENGEVTPARTIQRPAPRLTRSHTISHGGARQKPQLIQAQRPREYREATSPEAISAALRNHSTALRDLPGTREWRQKQNEREPYYRHYSHQEETQRRKERLAKEHDLPKQTPARKSTGQSRAPRTMPAPPAAPIPPTPLPYTDGFGRPVSDAYKPYDEAIYAGELDPPLMNAIPDDGYDSYYRVDHHPTW